VKEFKLYRLSERIYMKFPSVVDMATDIKSMQWDSLVSGKKLVRIRDALKNLVLKKRFLLQMSKTQRYQGRSPTLFCQGLVCNAIGLMVLPHILKRRVRSAGEYTRCPIIASDTRL
jgi:hypothetical protein